MESLKVLIVMLRACFILLLVAVSTQVFGQMSFDAPVITSLQIWGNQAVPGGSLKALMVTRASPWYDFLPKVQAHRFDAVTLGADLERLRAYYRDLGYFEVVVDSTVERSREDEVSLYIRIEEGPLTRIARAAVVGAAEVEGALTSL